jgi:putative transposase
VLGPELVELWKHNYSVYGRRKLTKAARRAGHDVGRDQVARLMREQGIRGASRAKKHFTTKADPSAVRAPDLVNRNFTASRPDALWVADFTYCSTWSGIVYVAFIIDVFSRRLVGWKAARSMTANLVIDALNMAAWTRRHTTIDGLICHTDAGSQGEIKWSSQHLDSGGGRWRQCGNVSERSSFIEGRSHHRDGPRWPGAKTGSNSGRRSVAA